MYLYIREKDTVTYSRKNDGYIFRPKVLLFLHIIQADILNCRSHEAFQETTGSSSRAQTFAAVYDVKLYQHRQYL